MDDDGTVAVYTAMDRVVLKPTVNTNKHTLSYRQTTIMHRFSFGINPCHGTISYQKRVNLSSSSSSLSIVAVSLSFLFFAS